MNTLEQILNKAALENPDIITNPNDAIKRLTEAVDKGILNLNPESLNDLTSKYIAYQMLVTLGKLTRLDINRYMRILGQGLRENNPVAVDIMIKNLTPKY